MFHLAAWAASLGTTADTDITAATDDILTIQNSHFVLAQEMKLIAALAMSATLSRAKIASPTMRQIASPFIRPIRVAATPGDNVNMWLLDHSPFSIKPYEEIQVQATSAIAMGTEPFAAFAWLQDNFVPIPTGNIIPLRFTSSTAAVSNTWTTLSLTFADTIPTGRYAAVLSECQSTNARAHRWIFSNQVWRSGFPSFTALSQRLPYAIEKGQFGVMGYFNSNDLPRFQVFVNGTDNAHEGYLHAVRIGNIYGG